MTYSELKEKAKELGLPTFNVSKADLEKAVEEAEAKENSTQTPPEKEKSDTPKEDTKENEGSDEKENEEEKEEPEYNLAIVSNRGHEVRRFTQEIHGKNFATLAKEFAIKHKHEVKLGVETPPVFCKNCGKRAN